MTYTNKAELATLARDIVTHVQHGAPMLLPAMPEGFAKLQPNGADSHWRREWHKFVTFMNTGAPMWAIFQPGNSKLPFVAFSALPAITCPGAGNCLDWCYSFKAWRFPAAFFRQLQNTVLLLTGEGRATIRRAFAMIEPNVDVRLYVDGDIDSIETMGFWFNLLAARQDLRAYGYSKSWALFLQWAQMGRPLPSNYVLNASSGSKYDDRMLAKIKDLPVYRGTFEALPIDDKMPSKTDQPQMFQNWASKMRGIAKNLGLGNVWVCPGKCGECTPNVHACGSQKFANVPVVIGIH